MKKDYISDILEDAGINQAAIDEVLNQMVDSQKKNIQPPLISGKTENAEENLTWREKASLAARNIRDSIDT